MKNYSTTFAQLDDQSKVWIYQSDRKLTDEEVKQISESGTVFVNQWTAHNVQLKGSFEVLYNRFLVLVVDETHTIASGCSIDKSVRFMQELEKQFGIRLFDRMNFAFKKNDEVVALPRGEFESQYKSGSINNDTLVFNNLVSTKAELQSKWEIPLKESWHLQLVS